MVEVGGGNGDASARVGAAIHVYAANRPMRDRVFADASMIDRDVKDVIGAPLPTIGAGEHVHVAVDRLEGASALLVLDRGHPVGVITRSDVLATLATRSR